MSMEYLFISNVFILPDDFIIKIIQEGRFAWQVYCICLIGLVDHFNPALPVRAGEAERKTGSVYTASGTCHYFNEVECLTRIS